MYIYKEEYIYVSAVSPCLYMDCILEAIRWFIVDLLGRPFFDQLHVRKKSAAELCPSFSIAANQVQADCFSCSSGTEWISPIV